MQEQISFLFWIHVGQQGAERGVTSLGSVSASTGGLRSLCPGISDGRQALSQHLTCTRLVLMSTDVFSRSPSRYCDLQQTLADGVDAC